MPALQLTTEQVLDLVRQLPPEGRRSALMALASDGSSTREQRMEFAEEQLRRLCSERGLNWDQMSEDGREELVDDLTHEDRPCQP
jgi:hypothetical protein